MHKKKLLYLIAILFWTTLSISPYAYAEEIPVLTWERGQVQNIILGQGKSSESWDLYLKSNYGQILRATKSLANEANYYVYSLSIPSNFPISGYVIEAKNISGEIKQVAGVQVVEKISTEITRTPIELFIVLIGISYYFFLLNYSKNREISLHEISSNTEQQNAFKNSILNRLQRQVQKTGKQSLLRILLSEELKFDYKYASTVNIVGILGILTLTALQFSQGNWTFAGTGFVAICLLLGNISITYGILMMLLSMLFLVLNIALTKTFSEILSIMVISSIFTLPNLYNQFLSKIFNNSSSAKIKFKIYPFLSAIIASLAAYQLLLVFESLNPNQILLGYSKEMATFCLFVIFASKNLQNFRQLQSTEIVKIIRSIGPLISLITSIFISSIVYIWTSNLILFAVAFLTTILILSSNWLQFNFSKKVNFRSVEPLYVLIVILVVILSTYFSVNVLPMDVINQSHLGLFLIFFLDLLLAIYLMFSKTQSEVIEKI